MVAAHKLNKSLTLNCYEECAEAYAVNTESLHPHLEAEKFIEKLPQQATILDIGCGPGRDAKVFEEAGLNVVGVDFSAKMIALAKKGTRKAEFHLMDIEKLDFPTSTFEGAWASASFLHLSKKSIPQVFQSIHALLKRGGIFYLSVKRGVGEGLITDERYEDRQKFCSFFEEEELLKLLKEAQFEILERALTEKKSTYETHSMIRIFCKKGEES